MRRVAVITTAACILLALLTATSAGAKVRIVRIDYNPPGVDTGSNRSLKKERVKITNFGSQQRKLRGWKIRDRQGNVYVFGLFALDPGDSIILHTGNGNENYVSEPQHAFWRLDHYVWNNGGDRAKLTNRIGRFVDSCSYSGGGTTVRC
jgi:hypothetical protein